VSGPVALSAPLRAQITPKAMSASDAALSDGARAADNHGHRAVSPRKRPAGERIGDQEGPDERSSTQLALGGEDRIVPTTLQHTCAWYTKVDKAVVTHKTRLSAWEFFQVYQSSKNPGKNVVVVCLLSHRPIACRFFSLSFTCVPRSQILMELMNVAFGAQKVQKYQQSHNKLHRAVFANEYDFLVSKTVRSGCVRATYFKLDVWDDGERLAERESLDLRTAQDSSAKELARIERVWVLIDLICDASIDQATDYEDAMVSEIEPSSADEPAVGRRKHLQEDSDVPGESLLARDGARQHRRRTTPVARATPRCRIRRRKTAAVDVPSVAARLLEVCYYCFCGIFARRRVFVRTTGHLWSSLGCSCEITTQRITS